MRKLQNLSRILLSMWLAWWLGGTMPALAYTPAEVSQLVAPVALYPDALLSNVLAASAYPDEIAQAQQWVTQNGPLQPVRVNSTLASINWDPSVKSLTAFPDVLSYLAANLAWTEALGNAFLTQPDAVEAAIQTLRLDAQNDGALQSNSQILVADSGGAVVIEAANPQYLYVPEYDFDTVYYQGGSPILWGVGINCGQSLWLGCFNWQYNQMYYGQGYNYYYPGNLPTSNAMYQNVYGAVSRHRGAWRFNQAHRRGRPVPPVTQLNQGRGFAVPAGGYSAGARTTANRVHTANQHAANLHAANVHTARQQHVANLHAANVHTARQQHAASMTHTTAPRFSVPRTETPSSHRLPGLYNVRPGVNTNIERSQGAASRHLNVAAPVRPIMPARMSRPALRQTVPMPRPAYRRQAPRPQMQRPAPPQMRQQAPRPQMQRPAPQPQMQRQAPRPQQGGGRR